MEQYFIIGQIVNTHGVKGGTKVLPLTDDVKRFNKLKKVYIEINNNLVEYEIKSVKFLKNFVILQFKNVENMNEAEKLKGNYIKINRSDAIKLPKDSYFISDLIGIDVKTDDGEYLGKLTDVLHPGGNDVYVVKNQEKNLLIPAAKEFVKKVDLENKIMIVKLIEGLKDLWDLTC